MSKILTCPAIGTMVNMAKDRLHHCCFAPFNIAPPKICDFSNGGNGIFPIDLYRKSTELLEQKNQTENAPCKGCYQLRSYAKPDRNAAFKRIALNTFSICNSACIYCGDPQEDTPYDIVPVVTQMYNSGLIDSTTDFGWGGGEPSIYPDLDPTFRLLAERGVPQHIYTNVIILSETLRQGLRDGTLNELTISLDSGTRETMEKIRQRNCFDKVWKNLRTYVEAGGERVQAKYILFSQNREHKDIDSFVALCKEAGISRIALATEVNEVITNSFNETHAKAAARLIDLATTNDIYIEFWRDHCFKDMCFIPPDVRQMIQAHTKHQMPLIGDEQRQSKF